MSDRLPIHDLIEAQLKQLGMCRGELARQCGFKNTAKGIRRIESVCHGELDGRSAQMVLHALPAALKIESDVIKAAVRATAKIKSEAERQAAIERESTWRASFIPHGYLIGTEARPSQITIYGLTGGPERWLRSGLSCRNHL